MNQIYAWLSDKAVATQKFATDTYTQVKDTATHVYSLMNTNSEENKNKNTALIESWRGASIPVNTEIVPAMIESEELRRVSGQTLYYQGLLYLGQLLVFQLGKAALYASIPGAEGSYAESALDIAAIIYFGAQSIQMGVRALVLDECASKATENYFNNKPLFGEMAKGKRGEAIQARYTRFVYQSVKIGAAKCTEGLPIPFSYVPASAIRMLAYGQDLMNYNLEDKTFEERSAFFAENNARIFFLGFSYYMTMCLFHAGFYCATGANKASFYYRSGASDYFIGDAFANLAYPFFIMTVRLMANTLPKNSRGIDFFYYFNLVTEAIIKNTSDMISKSINNPNSTIQWWDVKKKIQNFPPFQFVTNLLFPREMLSFRRLFKTPPMQLLLDLKEKDFRAFLKEIVSYRESVLIYLWPKRLLSEGTRNQLNLILNQSVGDTIKYVDEFLKEARRKELAPAAIQQQPSENEPTITEHEPNSAFINDVSSLLEPPVQIYEQPVNIDSYFTDPHNNVVIEEIPDQPSNPVANVNANLSEGESDSESEDEVVINGNQINVEDDWVNDNNPINLEDWVDIPAPRDPPYFQQGIFARRSTLNTADEPQTAYYAWRPGSGYES